MADKVAEIQVKEMGRTYRKRKTRKISKSTSPSMEVPDNKIIGQLMRWMCNYNVFIKGVTIKDFKGSGKGIKTTRHIEKASVIISLPRETLLTFDTVWYNYGKNLSSSHSFLTAKDIFISMLIAEYQEREKSKYWFYIQTIPQSFTTLNTIKTGDAYLLPPFILEEMKIQKRKIHRHYTRLKDAMKTHSILKQEINICDVQWAWNVINTRSVYYTSSLLNCKDDIDVSEIDFALAPLLDMLNHNCHVEVDAGFDTEQDCYQIRTYSSYKPGDQVFINYGAHSNRTLLYEYGFILADNIHANVPIMEEMFFQHFSPTTNATENARVKAKLKSSLGVCIEKMCCTLHDTFDWSFLTAAHVMKSRRYSFEQHCKNDGDCVIIETSMKLLHSMISKYTMWIDGLNTHDEISDTLSAVLSLLISEKIVLEKTRNELIATKSCNIT